MNAETHGNCANQPCRCAARPGDAYCSDYCKHIATSGPPRVETICECGHADCRERRLQPDV